MREEEFSLLCDFYELTMCGGYLKSGLDKKIVYFDVFFRSVPDGGGFAVAAGLEQVIRYIEALRFDASDIRYLRERNRFDEDFLMYLRQFHFTGDIWAVPEGTPVFPQEPILTVRAPAMEAQLIETYVLLCLNHQSLIATKANRIVRAARGRSVMEFGSRRAQGAEGAYLGARAAYIGGCSETSCTLTGKLFGIPVRGTMAHAWVQMFDTEYEAFRAYCRAYPRGATLLVDTYSTLKSGVPNAIRAFREAGITDCAIRLDSGDIAYLSREARKMLDGAGLTECKIVASNSLDEYLIRDLLLQGAAVDVFGVGERLITSRSTPVFGGVYKLVAVEDAQGNILPKIKMSENIGKITTPHFKSVFRFYDRKSGKALADEICLFGERIAEDRPHTVFDPAATWKRKTLADFTVKKLPVPVFRNGVCVYKTPSIEEIQTYCREQVALLWDEVKRFENPHAYYVDLSENLWQVKQKMLREYGAPL